MLTGEELREILDSNHALAAMPVDERLVELDSNTLAEVLSHTLMEFEFDSWQYAAISEACSRLSPNDTQEE